MAQAKSRGTDGVESDHIYWYNKPLALLRLIPSVDMSLSRAQLRALSGGAKPVPLPLTVVAGLASVYDARFP
jgi:hypothetical protein